MGFIRRLTEYYKKAMLYAGYAASDTHMSQIALTLRCLFNCLLGRCTIRDYFIHQFYLLNRRGKKRFVSNTEMLKWNQKHLRKEDMNILDDKERALSRFDKYLQRDWCSSGIRSSVECFTEFCTKHRRCIYKPNFGTCGTGIELLDLSEISPSELRERCIRENAVVEELIVQHERLNDLYPGSVNTMRIGTLNGKVLGATIRMGVNGGFTDNFCSGGIIACVDAATGIITRPAKDQHNREFFVHPDTNITIVGFEIPFWNEVISFVEALAAEVPGIPFVGWDIAVTQDGPTFVEGNENSAINVYQTTSGKGYRPIIEKEFGVRI